MPHLSAIFRYGTILYVCTAFLLVVSCGHEHCVGEYFFGTKSTAIEMSFQEMTLIESVESAVTYMTGANFSETIAREKMNQVRIIESTQSVSSNQHIYILNQDQMTTTVHYVDGFHFASDGRVETEENPLQGKTLSRKLVNGQWSDFVLLDEAESIETVAAIEKVNNDYALDKGIYPEGEVMVGESWSGTNRVEGSNGEVSELIYNATFERVEAHQGILCAKVNMHNVLRIENGGKTTLDVQGTSYYSFEYGIQIGSEMTGGMKSESDHDVGDHVVRRVVSGNVSIINKLSFENKESSMFGSSK